MYMYIRRRRLVAGYKRGRPIEYSKATMFRGINDSDCCHGYGSRNKMAAMIQVQKTKQVKYGLEVPNGLTYQGWEPGGEYTKPFILKNVNLKTQKVKYK